MLSVQYFWMFSVFKLVFVFWNMILMIMLLFKTILQLGWICHFNLYSTNNNLKSLFSFEISFVSYQWFAEISFFPKKLVSKYIQFASFNVVIKVVAISQFSLDEMMILKVRRLYESVIYIIVPEYMSSILAVKKQYIYSLQWCTLTLVLLSNHCLMFQLENQSTISNRREYKLSMQSSCSQCVTIVCISKTIEKEKQSFDNLTEVIMHAISVSKFHAVFHAYKTKNISSGFYKILLSLETKNHQIVSSCRELLLSPYLKPLTNNLYVHSCC